MWILIMWALLFLFISLRWYLWSCEDFAQRKIFQGWFFLIGSLVWMAFAGCLALVAAP